MARKLCSICGTRSVGTGGGNDADHARVMGYCNPCMTEADWENTHSDEGHGVDDIPADDDCWICHPELNPTTQDAAPRTGHTNTRAYTRTSHAGCHHDRTPKDRAACRKAGGAGSPGSLALFPAPKKGKK